MGVIGPQLLSSTDACYNSYLYKKRPAPPPPPYVGEPQFDIAKPNPSKSLIELKG